jgi:hypothetical protein
MLDKALGSYGGHVFDGAVFALPAFKFRAKAMELGSLPVNGESGDVPGRCREFPPFAAAPPPFVSSSSRSPSAAFELSNAP